MNFGIHCLTIIRELIIREESHNKGNFLTAKFPLLWSGSVFHMRYTKKLLFI